MLFVWEGGCCTCWGYKLEEGKVRGYGQGVCEGVCGYHKVILEYVRNQLEGIHKHTNSHKSMFAKGMDNNYCACSDNSYSYQAVFPPP